MNRTSTKNILDTDMYFAVIFCIFFVFVYTFYCILFSCDLLREKCNSIHNTDYTFQDLYHKCYILCVKNIFIFKNKKGYQSVSISNNECEITPISSVYSNNPHQSDTIHLSIHEKDNHIINDHSTYYSNEEIEQYICDKNFIFNHENNINICQHVVN